MGPGRVRGVLEGSEGSWKGLRVPGMVRGVLEGSEGSCKGPRGPGRVQGVLEGSEGSCKVPPFQSKSCQKLQVKVLQSQSQSLTLKHPGLFATTNPLTLGNYDII